MGAFRQLLMRDIQLALREGGALGTALGFYLLVVALLPLGLGPDLKLLSRIAPGLLWIALLLAALLSLGRIFETDNDDGSLEVMALGGLPLELVAAAKALAHWITTGIPLALLAPLLGILLNLEFQAYGPLVLTMLAGTPAISFLGAVGAALTLRARRGGLLLALLVLPLFIPTLIYGITAITSVTVNVDGGFSSALSILTAVSLGSMVLGPIAAAAALRIQMQ
ncbi:MAG: heme exporter protein CcmB [Pseudomonadota bacterium]